MSTFKLDYERVRRALEKADDHATIKKMRTFQRKAIAEYVGRHHVDGGDLCQLNGVLTSNDFPDELHGLQPDSPLGEMARTFLSHLTADGFKPKAEPRLQDDNLVATIQTVRLEQVAEDTQMEQRAGELVLDALLGIGIGKVRIMRPDMPQPFGTQRYDELQPYLWRVPVSNWIVDPNCDGDLHRAQYVADRYLVDRQALLASGTISGEMADWINRLPAIWDTERKRSSDEMDLNIVDLIELVDIEMQIGGKRLCATMPHYDDNADGFLVEPYEHFGPAHDSMYVPLTFGFLSGSMQPVSPASVLMDAHLATAMMAARCVEEGWTARRKLVVDNSSKQMAAQINDRRSDMTIFGDPNAAKEVNYGGMVEPVMAAYAFSASLVNRNGPYTPSAKGQNAGADTATGASLLAGNSDTIMRAWRLRRDTAFSRMLSIVGWYLNANPKPMLQIPVPLPDGSTIAINFDPSVPIGSDLSWESLRYKAVTGARTPMDPRMRQRSLVELMQILMPTLAGVAQVGGDVAGAVRALANAWEWPELAQVFPTQDAAAIAAAVKQITEQRSQGSASRQGQMQSDYAPAMAGG